MNTLEWPQFILVSYAGILGKNIKTLVAFISSSSFKHNTFSPIFIISIICDALFQRVAKSKS